MSKRIEAFEQKAKEIEGNTEKLGSYLVELFQFVALFVIGGTVVWSAAHEYIGMMAARRASVEDILLLFIYLELGAMVGIYFKTNRLPVQFLIYVAITVMTRTLASSASVQDMEEVRMVAITGAILILALAVLVLRYATFRFSPFISHEETDHPEALESEREYSRK